MNTFHKSRTASGTTTALPCESNAIELERRGARFLVRIITKVWEAITSRMPVGYEDETGFHYGVAEARPFLIQTGRIPNRSPRETCLKERRVAMRVPNFDSGGQSLLKRDVSSLHPGRLSPESSEPSAVVRPTRICAGGGPEATPVPYRDQ